MSKTGVQSKSKDGRVHESTHENESFNNNFNYLTNSATYFNTKRETMLFKTEEPVSASPMYLEADNNIVKVTQRSVVNDADFGGGIKTMPFAEIKHEQLDSIDNLEYSKVKASDFSIRSSNPLELDGLVGEDMLGIGTVGVGTETISLPIALDSNYLVSDFSDNLKDFVFSVADGDNLSKVDPSSSFESTAVDNTSFSAFLGSEDSIPDTLQVSLYDDSDPIVKVENASSHSKEDPTMTSVISKRSDAIVFQEHHEPLNYTSIKVSSPTEMETIANHVKLEPIQNVFHSNSNSNENFFLTLKSQDKLITSPCKLTPSTNSPSVSCLSNEVNSSNLHIVPNFVSLLGENTGNSSLKSKPEMQISGIPSMSFCETPIVDSIPQTSQQTLLSNQNVNVTTISISNKENNAIKILVHSDEGQNVYVINSADLNDGNNKISLNENQLLYTSASELNHTVNEHNTNFGDVTINEIATSGSCNPSCVSGIFLVPVQTSAEADSNQKSKKKNMVCSEPGCNKTFKRASKLRVHKMLHTGERPFKCTYPDCIWAFTTSHKLKRHLESHEGRKDFICEYPGCGHKFTTVYNLNTHRKLHERPYTETCPEQGCGQPFHTKRQLEVHLRIAHGVEEKTFKCPNPGCQKVFYSSGCMGSHMRVHAQNVEDFKCKFPGCGKEFTKLCRLRQHEKLHTGEKPYICNYEGCSWAFATTSKLKRHQTKHTGVRKWQCHICRKFFQRSEHLKGHLITHSGDKPFACPVEGCGNAFTAKSSLYVHLRKHDESGKTIVYHCPMDKCDRHYASKASLRQHILVKHCTLPINTQPQGVINWLNLLGSSNDPVTDQTLVEDQLSHNKVLAQTALVSSQEAVSGTDFLTGEMAEQTLLSSPACQVISDQTCSNLVPQLVVVSSGTVSHISTSPSLLSASSVASLSSSSSSLSPSPASSISKTALAATVVASSLPLQQQLLQQKVVDVEELLQQQERMSYEAVERGKKRQFVFENMQGSARTDERSNEIISQRAFKRWQKQKEIEAAKLKAHLESQTLPLHSSSAPSIIPQVSPSSGDFKSPDSSNVSLASQAANMHPSRIDGGSNALLFKEIPDMELQAEGIQGSVLDGRTSSTTNDSFMTELFIKDPETGMTYRQTQLLQDDPPTLCLLEDIGEVEPSHNVVLDAGLEGNLMDESLSFQDLE